MTPTTSLHHPLGGASPAPAAPLLALLALLAGCVDLERDNPYDPAAPNTVKGQVRVDLVFPPLADGDALGLPGAAEEAIGALRLSARRLDARPTDAPTPPIEGVDDRRLIREAGRLLLRRTFALPQGDHIIEVLHLQGLFEPAQRPVRITIGERSERIEVPLERAGLRVAARLTVEGEPPTESAWLELRGLEAPQGNCFTAGRPLRRFDLDGSSALRGVVGELPAIPRPNEPWICALAGAAGYRTAALPAVRIHRSLSELRDPGPCPQDPCGADAPVLTAVDLGAVDLMLSRFDVRLLGLPEVRALTTGTLDATDRISGRMVLLHLVLRRGLSFAPDAEPEQRVERVAVLDALDDGRSSDPMQFFDLDALPRQDEVPYLGLHSPSACSALDPTSVEVVELVRQRLRDELTSTSGRNASSDERLLPYCHAGGGALTVVLETADGAWHHQTITYQLDRAPPGPFTLDVTELITTDADTVTARPAERWRGRYMVEAASQVRVTVELDERAGEWRLGHAAVPGTWTRAGWRFDDCPPPGELLVRPTVAEAGRPATITPTLLPPEPVEGDPFRLRRNRLCLAVEDAAGLSRAEAFDFDVGAGALSARLMKGNRDAETLSWSSVPCPWAEFEECFGGQSAGFVRDQIVVALEVDVASVHETVQLGFEHGESYGLRSVRIVAGADGAPRPFSQSQAFVLDFPADGAHRLRVTGQDLLGRAVDFLYDGRPEVRFVRDTVLRQPVTRAFLSCEACLRTPTRCEGRDPCKRCIAGDFLRSPTHTLAPAHATLPVHHGFDINPERLCAISQTVRGEADEALLLGTLCDGTAEVTPLPAEAPIPESGQTVELLTALVDPACNSYIDPQPLRVDLDDAPPRLARAGDDPARFGTAINCRQLTESCNGASSCWRSTTSRAACAADGLRLLENVRVSVFDPASWALEGPVIRYRLLLVQGDEAPHSFAVCGEPDWAAPPSPATPRHANCQPGPDCGCAPHEGIIQLRAGEGDEVHPLPMALYRDGQRIPVTLARHDDLALTVALAEEPGDGGIGDAGIGDAGADAGDAGAPAPRVPLLRVLHGVRLYLAVEDAVGNRDIQLLVDADCLDGDCAERTYSVPILLPLVGEVSDWDDARPSWDRVRDCVDDGNGNLTPAGDFAVAEPILEALCAD